MIGRKGDQRTIDKKSTRISSTRSWRYMGPSSAFLHGLRGQPRVNTQVRLHAEIGWRRHAQDRANPRFLARRTETNGLKSCLTRLLVKRLPEIANLTTRSSHDYAPNTSLGPWTWQDIRQWRWQWNPFPTKRAVWVLAADHQTTNRPGENIRGPEQQGAEVTTNFAGHSASGRNPRPIH